MPKKPLTLEQNVEAAYQKLRAKGYGMSAVDLSAATMMEPAELLLGLLGIVNAQRREIAALSEQIKAVDRYARHKK